MISQYPKIDEGAQDEDDNWSLDVCGYAQDLEERKAEFNHEGGFRDCEMFKVMREEHKGSDRVPNDVDLLPLC